MPLPDPIPDLKRAAAARVVAGVAGWSQSFAADMIGTDQPRVSDLRAGRLERFSLESLIRMLARLHHSVSLEIVEVPRRYGPRGSDQAQIARGREDVG